MCGVLPALELSRHDSSETLKEGGRSGSGGRRQRRIFASLVTAQIALAVVLLVGGGLFVRSFARLIAVDPGFRAESVLTVPTSLPLSAYSRGSDIRPFYSRLLERIEALPGVTAAGASTFLPMSVTERRVFTIEAPPAASLNLSHTIANDWVAGRFFEAFGIPLKSGRYLAPEDASAAEPVVVINETMARHYWPGQDPVGQRIAWGLPNDHGRWMRIVGIAASQTVPLTGDVPQTTHLASERAFLTENVLVFSVSESLVRTENDLCRSRRRFSLSASSIPPFRPAVRR